MKKRLSFIAILLSGLIFVRLMLHSENASYLVSLVLFPEGLSTPSFNPSIQAPVRVASIADISRSEVVYFIEYINEILEADLVEMSEPGEKADIIIIQQNSRNGKFPKEFRRIYEREFGVEKTLRAESLGYFNIDSTETNPCFSAGVFDLDAAEETSKRAFSVINITASRMDNDLLKSCFLEEIAHAIFGFADRNIGESLHSIFNSNSASSYLSDFSSYDVLAMQFVLSGFGTSLETREELILKIEKFMNRVDQ